MKKGQAAMEFLMTYGWAILVVLAAIGALAYFGVLSTDKLMPDKCLISGGFSCAEFKLDGATNTTKLYIQNNLGADADQVDVTLKSATNLPCPGSPQVLGAIQNGVKDPTPATFTSNSTCDFTGSSFKGNIEIVYKKSGETETHVSSGSISGRFEGR